MKIIRNIIKEELDKVESQLKLEIRCEMCRLKVELKNEAKSLLEVPETKAKITDTITKAVKLFSAHNGQDPTMLNIGQHTWDCLRNQCGFILLSSDTFLGMRIFITSHFEGFTVCTFK